jgi:hypothetical protein
VIVESEAAAVQESAAAPAVEAPPILTARPPIVPPRIPRAQPRIVEPVTPPLPTPPPPMPVPPRRSEPPVDMMAAINARREQRRAAESAAARGSGPPTDEQVAEANIQRNLKSPGEGVGGVFQILSKGTRRAEFAFNGWRPDSEKRWREVIEVDAGQGGDVDRAIVKRMIELIRTHYNGDFKWESRRLGRTVVLSARQEDTDGLEDFLVREFFGTPTVAAGSR